MASKHDEPIDPSKPALVLVHGTAGKRYRLLDQDALVIGRARGSDLCLDATDVSSVHCVLMCRPDGYRIRDCGSRSGTRLNGIRIRDERLYDSDLVQVGPFSFRVHLPGAAAGQARPAADERLIQRLERSRKKFAERALRQRQQLRQQQVAALPADFQEQASALCDRVRDFEQRLRLLDEGERDLSRDRELLRKEQLAHEKNIRLFDEELVERRAALEAEAAEWQRQWEEQRRQTTAAPTDAAGLEQERDRLALWQQELTRRGEELQAEQRRIQVMQENWLATQAEVGTQLKRQSATLEATEKALREQRDGLAALVAHVKRLHGGAAAPAAPPAAAPAAPPAEGAEQLRQENEELRRSLAGAARQHEEELQALREDQEVLLKTLQEHERSHNEEVKGLRHEQKQLKQAIQEAHTAAPATPAVPAPDEQLVKLLHAEVEMLRELLQEKDALIAEIQQQPRVRSAQSESDINIYEEELNQYRRQLEVDRDKLNQEIKALRERNTELDQATREMELEMARERAELARERTRMERMREDIRLETERMQRDHGVRERLAPVQKLREELNERKQGGSSPAEDQGLNGRLRGLRGRPNDPAKG